MEYIMTAALIIAALWSVLCRINHMQYRVTLDSVFLQHAALGLGLFSALVLPANYALMCLAAGVLVFLLSGAARWKDGAPEGITKPGAVEPKHWAKIAGGRDERH